MTDAEREFLQALAAVQWPEIRPVFFRLYHDDQGQALFYSQEDLPGKYINITPDEFLQGRLDVRVEAGRLVRDRRVPRLRPSDHGTPCHPHDVSLVTRSDPARLWALKK